MGQRFFNRMRGRNMQNQQENKNLTNTSHDLSNLTSCTSSCNESQIITKCQSFSSWWLNHQFEKYARPIGSFPQTVLKIKDILKKHHLDGFFTSKNGVSSYKFPPLFLCSKKIAVCFSRPKKTVKRLRSSHQKQEISEGIAK